MSFKLLIPKTEEHGYIFRILEPFILYEVTAGEIFNEKTLSDVDIMCRDVSEIDESSSDEEEPEPEPAAADPQDNPSQSIHKMCKGLNIFVNNLLNDISGDFKWFGKLPEFNVYNKHKKLWAPESYPLGGEFRKRYKDHVRKTIYYQFTAYLIEKCIEMIDRDSEIDGLEEIINKLVEGLKLYDKKFVPHEDPGKFHRLILEKHPNAAGLLASGDLGKFRKEAKMKYTPKKRRKSKRSTRKRRKSKRSTRRKRRSTRKKRRSTRRKRRSTRRGGMEQFLKDGDDEGARISPHRRTLGINRSLQPIGKIKKGDEGRRAMDAKKAKNLERKLHKQKGLEVEAKEEKKKAQEEVDEKLMDYMGNLAPII